MATVDFTLEELQDGVRGIVREELKVGVREIVREELKNEVREIVREEIAPMRTEVDVLRGELHVGLSAVRSEMKEGFSDIRGEIQDVKTMLTEDFHAEAGSLDRTNKRLARLRREFDAHVSQGQMSDTD